MIEIFQNLRRTTRMIEAAKFDIHSRFDVEETIEKIKPTNSQPSGR